ncbi:MULTISPECIES: hypothetical protein [unclassified Bacillus (in: firmicutes)]|uniref:hypothetical protein n=1 Tax=unclassified Bacillus (in: firmicutes) TaxID=185979 RepID=UPI00025981CD|nr:MULTISPECIES: hypothetical protein [unclassified Bacillus (in: firmicutes)]AFI28612.1 hypothetical protein MY9_2078 [Bacillus sp. JS]GFM13725.1 uncharacterized protein FW1_contig-04-71 [Bacillus sp. FW1]
MTEPNTEPANVLESLLYLPSLKTLDASFAVFGLDVFFLLGFPFFLFDEALVFWGGFVVVYFVLALIASLLFRNVGSSSRRYQA